MTANERRLNALLLTIVSKLHHAKEVAEELEVDSPDLDGPIQEIYGFISEKESG